MANINNLKIVGITGEKNLIKELVLLTNVGKSPIIISEAGLGKQEY